MGSKVPRKFPLVITVFSAPNYCGYYGNEAATLRIVPPEQELSRSQLPAIGHNDSLPILEPSALTFESTSDLPSVLSDNGISSPRKTSNGLYQYELSESFIPKLIYNQYSCVEELPFCLPNSENAIQHSIPLIVEKLQSIFEYIKEMIPPDEDFIESPKSIIPSLKKATIESPATIRMHLETEKQKPRDKTPQKIDESFLSPDDSRRSNEQIERLGSTGGGLSVPLDPTRRRVSDRIKDYEANRVPIVITSGNAMLRRKSIQALSGSFSTKMKLYLSVIKSPFDKIKHDNRASELRPPISQM